MDPEAFKQAVLAGDLDAVRRCLDAGVDTETRIDAKRGRREAKRDLTPDGFRALHVAAYDDDAALAELLLARGADPWSKTRFNQVPLVIAAEWNSPGFVRAFLKAGIDPDATNARPVVAAAGRANAEVVEILLAAGARTALDIAVSSACNHSGSPRILTALLDAGALPETPANREDWTARISALYWRKWECLRILRERTPPLGLIDAAIDGDLAAVESFLASGADPNATVRHGISALLGAASEGHARIVTRLLDAGAKVNHRGVLGLAIERALLGNHLDVATILHERGSALHTARYGSVFGALINRGVDAATLEWVGQRHRPERIDALLGRAALGGDVTAARVLLELGASVNGRDGFGRPALTLAAYANRVEMVAFLLERGADPAIRDENGRPILHYLLVYDDYTDDWIDPDFDESSYDRDSPVLQSEAVRLLLEAGTPLPWSDAPSH